MWECLTCFDFMKLFFLDAGLIIYNSHRFQSWHTMSVCGAVYEYAFVELLRLCLWNGMVAMVVCTMNWTESGGRDMEWHVFAFHIQTHKHTHTTTTTPYVSWTGDYANRGWLRLEIMNEWKNTTTYTVVRRRRRRLLYSFRYRSVHILLEWCRLKFTHNERALSSLFRINHFSCLPIYTFQYIWRFDSQLWGSHGLVEVPASSSIHPTVELNRTEVFEMKKIIKH